MAHSSFIHSFIHSCIHAFIQLINQLTYLLLLTTHENVFARSNTGVVSSNPTQGMDVCVYSVFVLGSVLATDWNPIQGVLPIVLD
jgi:hypothetical protein